MKYNPKRYFERGRILEWGKDLSQETMDALRQGEIFILLNKNSKPYSIILMDSYDILRERLIGEHHA